jgi:hypothetical protein
MPDLASTRLASSCRRQRVGHQAASKHAHPMQGSSPMHTANGTAAAGLPGPLLSRAAHACSSPPHLCQVHHGLVEHTAIIATVHIPLWASNLYAGSDHAAHAVGQAGDLLPHPHLQHTQPPSGREGCILPHCCNLRHFAWRNHQAVMPTQRACPHRVGDDHQCSIFKPAQVGLQCLPKACAAVFFLPLKHECHVDRC